MLIGDCAGSDLEIRAQRDGSHRLSGRFPYGKPAVLSDGGRKGRPRKEKFAPRAFAYRVEKPDEDIHLLAGHDFGKPLASKLAGTLNLSDSDEALTFEAILTRAVAETSHGRDVLALLLEGLATGISPGFRIPPARAVKDAEKIEEELIDPSKDQHGAIIRTILSALLYEFSIVTRPAFPEAQIQLRSWQVSRPLPPPIVTTRPEWRWR